MFDTFSNSIIQLFDQIDYWAIFVMMLVEGSLLPFPSEFPLGMIGILSAKGMMNPFAGLFVSLVAIFIGATVNYGIGYYFGDTFFEKYGKYFFIKKHAYHEAKRLYAEDADFYTFYGRLIPLVRQLMSLPAGIVRMPYGKFISLTLAGSAIWHTILIIVGYIVGDNIKLIKTHIIYISIIIVLGIAGLWLWKHRSRKAAARRAK